MQHSFDENKNEIFLPNNNFTFNITKDGIYVKDNMGYVLEKKQLAYIIKEIIKFSNKYNDEVNRYNKCHKKYLESKIYNKTPKEKFKGYVYFLESGGMYKIGYSKNVNRRLKELNKGPLDVKFIKKSKESFNAYKLEQYLHKKYKDFKIKNEWYNFNDKQIKDIFIYIDKIDEVQI